MRLQKRHVLTVLLGAVSLYFGVAAYGLHFETSRLLFPRTSEFVGPPAAATFSFKSASGNEMLVRRYGDASAGCVVFLPGQHGASPAYGFPGLAREGLAVFAIAYPGQDGADGHTELNEVEQLIGQAFVLVGKSCAPSRTVLVGVSLGAMLAAYTSRSFPVAGLVLSSAAPSLSSAIRVRLRSNWALAPLSMLPVSQLLPRDYSLVEALGSPSKVQTLIFQGTRDTQTPLELLRIPGVLSGGVQLVVVAGATHSSTFTFSQGAQLAAILNMLRSAGT